MTATSTAPAAGPSAGPLPERISAGRMVVRTCARRGVLFAARTAVAAGTAMSVGVLLALTASLTGYLAARPLLTLPLDEGVEVLSTVGFVLGAGTLLAAGLGFLLRSTAGALVSVFLLLLVLPGLLPQLGFDWLTDVADRLPGTGALFLLTDEPQSRGLTPWSSRIHHARLGRRGACPLVAAVGARRRQRLTGKG